MSTNTFTSKKITLPLNVWRYNHGNLHNPSHSIYVWGVNLTLWKQILLQHWDLMMWSYNVLVSIRWIFCMIGEKDWESYRVWNFTWKKLERRAIAANKFRNVKVRLFIEEYYNRLWIDLNCTTHSRFSSNLFVSRANSIKPMEISSNFSSNRFPKPGNAILLERHTPFRKAIQLD